MGRYREKIGDIVKDDQREEARIWWAIAGVALVILLFTVYHHAKALDLYFNAHRVEASYTSGDINAIYYDENGKKYRANVSGFFLIPKNGKITLYYKNNIAYAEPINSGWEWFAVYMVFGGALILSAWRIYKIYHPKKHPV